MGEIMGIGAAIGGIASGIGAIAGGGGGGGSSQPTYTTNNGSLGQGIGNILAGGLSSALGLQGLAGGNLNQLQAGAAAANPFGQYSGDFVGLLQDLLGSGPGQSSLLNTIQSAATSQNQLFWNVFPSSTISTGASGVNTNISTPGQTSTLQNLVNNPTQLIQTLQGGGVQTPSGIQAIANENPDTMTAGDIFAENQGLANLNRSLAQTGQVGSGNQYVAAEQYGQQFATQVYQQNVQDILSAQGTINQTAGTNQGLQSLVNAMGQNQFGNTLNLAQLLSTQQQNTFGNTLGIQQLLSQQQQNSQTNMQNLLSQFVGLTNGNISNLLGMINPLMTLSQATNSSPATAGGILANLGVANQTSAGNIASGLAGLGQGVGQLASAIPFSSSGSYNPGFSTGTGPLDNPSTYDYGSSGAYNPGIGSALGY